MLPNDSMRVGYVLKQYPRYSETFIVNEILAHEAAGLEIEIFSLRSPVDAHFQDVIARVRAAVTYVPSETPKATTLWALFDNASKYLPELWSRLETARGEDVRDIYQAVWLAHEARLKGITHLHAHFANAATSVARLAAHFAGLPYTFTAHAKDIFHESIQPDDLRRKLTDATAVVTVSDYNLRYLDQAYGPAAACVQRIYNGLDLRKFAWTTPRDRIPRIVSVGRLVEKKGFADLIDACAILAKQGTTFYCQIIGSGLLEADLRAQINRLGLQSIVQLIGPRPQSEIIRYVQDSAVFVAPCVVGADNDRDGLPTVLLEAMALGTPCISTDVTGIPEVVRNQQTGLVVPQHDPELLAAAIQRLLEDADLRVRLAAEARRLIEAEFNIYRNAALLRAIFQVAEPVSFEATQGVV